MNGGRHFRSIAYKHQSLDDWLLDFHLRQPNGCVERNTDFSLVTDIFAIGFEELVDLKAGNILSTRLGKEDLFFISLFSLHSRLRRLANLNIFLKLIDYLICLLCFQLTAFYLVQRSVWTGAMN